MIGAHATARQGEQQWQLRRLGPTWSPPCETCSILPRISSCCLERWRCIARSLTLKRACGVDTAHARAAAMPIEFRLHCSWQIKNFWLSRACFGLSGRQLRCKTCAPCMRPGSMHCPRLKSPMAGASTATGSKKILKTQQALVRLATRPLRQEGWRMPHGGLEQA